MKYIVRVKEIHERLITVEAKNKEDAIIAVKEGDGETIGTSYLETLDPDTWSVQCIQ